jgi:hypothetical protein
VISIGNADSGDYKTTEIIDRSGYEDVVKTFAEIIRCRQIRFESTLPETMDLGMGLQNYEYPSDFTLIIGKDFNGRYVIGN